VKLPDGRNAIVDGDSGQPIIAFKDWGVEGRGQVLSNLPKFAAESYKLDLNHKFKLAEIKEQGKNMMKYAGALRSDKQIKMTPEQTTALNAASKALQEASDPEKFDQKKYDAARHRFNGVVREIGVANKNFGLIPKDRDGKAEIDYKDWGAMFPPEAGETAADHMRRYRISTGGTAAASGGMARLRAAVTDGGNAAPRRGLTPYSSATPNVGVPQRTRGAAANLPTEQQLTEAEAFSAASGIPIKDVLRGLGYSTDVIKNLR
jgi:hypothetical protein